MEAAMTNMSLALLGQPNSGKSTLFNGLTGAHQRVGNWPGLTVEKKLGTFERDGVKFKVCDLPGAYSLSAQSDEERVTQAYIEAGEADVVCVLADASQLTRSLYMLADFAGVNVPCVLVLNMMDVAEGQGKRIDSALLESRLGIPVVPFVANDMKGYDELVQAVRRAGREHLVVDPDAMAELYAEKSPDWQREFEELGAAGAAEAEGGGRFTRIWLAAREAVKTERGAVNCATARFMWVDKMLAGVQTAAPESQPAFLARLDRALMSRRWGTLAGIGVLLLGLICAILVGSPFMALGQIPNMLADPLAAGLTSIGCPAFLTSLIASGLMAVLYFTISMSGFVFGVSFVFGWMDEVGIVSRISYVFDGVTSKIGLPGKVMMPFISSCGCNIAGVTGTRVVDSWGQRLLAIAMVWAIPCGSTLSIIPTLALTFFGFGGMILVVLGMTLTLVGVLLLVAKVFGRKLVPEDARTGLIMELPPYHKPKLKTLVRFSWQRAWALFKRAIKVITVVALVFWALSYSPTGDIAGSVIYAIGQAIEPVTEFFGLQWRTFLAFVSSMFAKEAVLGVMAALFGTTDPGLFTAAVGSKGVEFSTGYLIGQIPPAEALAFLFAVAFNVPCVMTLGATYNETHSLKWTVLIALFYIAMALAICFIVYHIGVLVL